MPTVTVIYGEQVKTVEAAEGSLVGEAIAVTGLPLEQPCAGRGTCGKCKVLAEAGLAEPDEIERKHLTAGELKVGNRLACRARIHGDARVTLAPIVVYSNKIFRASHRYKTTSGPLGLAIDFGSTTVAAFLTMLDTGEVCAGGTALNQMTVFGADVISRLGSAQSSPETADRLQRLGLASINQAIDSLKLSNRILQRVQRATVVGNVAMHHLLARYPVHTLTAKPFQPLDAAAIPDAAGLFGGIFPAGARVSLPPVICGFVGSDALACLAYFGYDAPTGPMVCIDLGTNGEVLVTDGRRILVASTAAGPAFEGVFISCGTRAVDGAVTSAAIEDGRLKLTTIAGLPPVGLTGSGLLKMVHELRKAGVIEPSGRISPQPPVLQDHLITAEDGGRKILLEPGSRLGLNQWDVRELQKAKGAIRSAIDTLMAHLGLQPDDLQRVILTGSFGGQIDIASAIELGMIPTVAPEKVETIANGAGLGAAMFLSDAGFALAESLVACAEQVDLDQDPLFISRYIGAMRLTPDLHQGFGG
ncbi:MAG: ASKHA domain-containing protein [Chloroflexota bacterium]